MMMRSVARILFSAACLLSLATQPLAFADDEEDAPKTRQSAREKRDARRNKGKEEEVAVVQGSMGKEIAALNLAAGELAKVQDEAAATSLAKTLCNKFAYMNPVLNGTEGELLELSRAQNRVSKEMWRLMAEPYFESSRLQEAWTLMVDQFSRRSSQRRRK